MSVASSPKGIDGPGARENGRRSQWLDVDWADHQRWLMVAGQPVNVIELGEGPPLVFVHGLAGSWTNWVEQLPEFATEHRVIAMDLPGFGHSPMPDQTISISAYARVLDGLLDALELDAAALVGNSMGGFVSAELAINFPHRVERLVLVSAAGLSTFEEPMAMRTAPVLQRLERGLGAQTGWVASKADTLARRSTLRIASLGAVTRHPSRLEPQIAAELLRGAGKPGFIQALRANIEYDFRERLSEIACPTLVVWGANDRVVPARDAETFQRLIPNSRKVIFEDTGHLPMIEQPASFNGVLAEFLSE